MPAPSNTSFATATNIPSLPASISQNVHDSGTTYEVFYKVTPSASGVLGVFGFGDLVTYTPRVRVYTETSPGVFTAWLPGLQVTAQNRPIQFPVTSGTEYFLKFTSNGGNPTPAVLLIEAEMAPSVVPPAGSFFINDDSPGFPAAVVSSTNGDDYNVLTFVTAPAGESGCVLRASGKVLLEDADAGTVKLYDSTLTTLIGTASINLSGANDLIRASQALDQFYVGVPNNGGSATVQIVDNTGTAGTSYTFPSVGLTGIAASNDGTIIYNAGQGGSVSAPIKQFLTASSTQGADLVAGVSGYLVSSLLVLADDSIVALYQNNSAPHETYAVRYDAAGATLQTYSVETAATSTSPRLFYAMTDASFGVWSHPLTAPFGISTLRLFAIGGSVLATITQAEFEVGSAQSDDTATPIARFGVSQSCPVVMLGSGGGTINVVKATVPAASTQAFDFTAGGGLSPTTFDLLDGETQTFTDVAAGDGYSIAETAVAGWSTSYTVSNGSPVTNLAVAAGETVTVTVTNTPIPPGEPTDPNCCAANGPGGGSPGGGSGYPPGTDPPRTVPPGGAPPAYITCNAGGGLPAFVANPADTQNLETCTIPRVHLKWTLRDASVRRWGQYDFTSGSGDAVTARVIKWGPVRQVLADRFGSFQVNHFTIRLSDTDRAIRTILTTTATKYIDGTEIEILIENAEIAAAPLVLARAVVTDYALNSDLTVDITCTDPLGYQYSNVSLDRLTPRRVFRTELFPLLPEESSGKAVPIVYGEYSDDILWLLKSTRIPVGILPIHYVGKPSSIPGLEGAPGDHAFAICGHALSCVQSVFASNLGKDVDGITDAPYGSVRMPTSLFGSEFFVPGIDVPLYYDLTGTDGITERFSFLFVKEGPRVKDHLNGRVPITINVLGIEDVGDGTGNTITSLTYQFLHYLCQYVLQDYRTGPWLPVPTFSDGTPKARTSSFQYAVGVQEARIGEPYVGSLYLGEQKAAREWNKAWQLSGDLRLGVNHQGQLLVTTLQDTASTSGLDTFTDTDHVFEESFEVDPKPEEIANVFTYEAGPEAATRRVSLPAVTIRNPTSITNHDEREAQALTYEATRHQTTADDVANRTLVRSADAPTDVSFTVNLRGAHLKLGQLRRLTHYQGIGPLGWTSRVLMVTGVTTTPDTDAFDCAIQCEDVHDILAAGEEVLVIDGAIGIDAGRIG